MPNWTTELPQRTGPKPMQLLRTPATGSLRGFITCSRLIGCDTHFWRGRTRPCEAPDCEACNDGSPTRWHGYLSLFNASSRAHAILELTASALEQLEEFRHTYLTLRGLTLVSRRAKSSRNARVILEVGPPRPDAPELPAEPDIAAIMCNIWRLPTGAAVCSSSSFASSALSLDPAVMDRFQDRIPKGNSHAKVGT